MWAGSSCEFHAPLVIGSEIERVSRIASITEKQGSSGSLAFVEIAHETRADGVLAVSEAQTLVYREAPPPGSPSAPPEPSDAQFDASGWDRAERITPSPELLFRYSALTFNTHRIHYDADYVREVENYRGLVVHGPLMASLLLQLAAREIGDNALASFAFRGLSPAIAGEGLVLAMRGAGPAIELGTFAADGRQVMTAEAST
jgi:3-methylfumaryl-CoA hydratase